MTVAYTEKRRGLSFGLGGATATRVLQIAGSDLEALCEELFSAHFIANLGYSIGKRAAHPTYDWLLADAISFEPGDPENPPSGAEEEYALLDATVTYRGERISGGLGDASMEPGSTHLTHTRTATAEMMTLPGHGFVWDDGDPVSEDVDTGIVVPTVTHEWTWHYVIDPPWSNLRKYLGTVNQAGTPYNDAVAETLLFAGYSANKEFNADGDTVWELGLTFIEKFIDLTPDVPGGPVYGWNHFWRANHDPSWCKLKDAESGKFVYPSGNHNNIFLSE